MDNFDVHEWNKKRYLSRIEENQSHLEFLSKYLEKMYPELRFEVRFGERIDAYGSQQDLADFGNKMHGKKFGDEYEVFHTDDDDRGEIVQIVKSDSIMRSSINEAYEPKHFDICPGAQALRDKVVAGEFGSTEEFDLDKWTKLHDALFALEKKVLKDKEAEDSDVSMAEKLRSEIINLSRDINIPSEAIGYLKGHVDIIKNISDYSALTETIKFIKENNPSFTTEEIVSELKEIKELGSQLNEKLCKKGEAYRKRRMAAGEKSSAYLSGRAVKVCKGQMSGKKKKK